MIEYFLIGLMAGAIIPGFIVLDKWAWVKLPKNAILQLEVSPTGTAKIVRIPDKLGPHSTARNPGGLGIIQYAGRPLDLRAQKCRLFLHYGGLPNTTPAEVGAYASLLKSKGVDKKALEEATKDKTPKEVDTWARQTANTTTAEQDAGGFYFDPMDLMNYVKTTESPEELETLASEFAMHYTGFKRWILGSGGSIAWGKLLMYLAIIGGAIFVLIFVAPALLKLVGMG